MPAVPFDASSAVIAAHVDSLSFDPSTLLRLQAEEYLLVHSCRARGTRDRKIVLGAQGQRLMDVRYNPQLVYEVEATALAMRGLANYHPGRALSDRSLTFANGGVPPFGFESEAIGGRAGKMIYLDPSHDPGAGDTLEVSFKVEHIFVDYMDAETEDSAEYLAFLEAYPVDAPEGGPSGSADPRSYGWRPGWRMDAGASTMLAKGPFTMFYLDSSVAVDGLTVSVWAEDAEGYHTGTAPVDDAVVSGNSFTVTVPSDGFYTLFLHNL